MGQANNPAALGSKAEQAKAMLDKTIARGFLPALFLTLFLAGFLCWIIASDKVAENVVEKMALAASVQVAFGMLTGFFALYIGLMMTWFGIEAAYEFSGKAGGDEAKGELSLKSASPGLLFAVGGMIVIAVALYKPITYEESGGKERSFSIDELEKGTEGPIPRRPDVEE